MIDLIFFLCFSVVHKFQYVFIIRKKSKNKKILNRYIEIRLLENETNTLF